MNTEFFTLYWWLGILGALLLSVIGTYLTRGIDYVLSLVSAKWKARVTRKQQELEELIDLHLRDPQLTGIAGFEMTAAFVRSACTILFLGIIALSTTIEAAPKTRTYALFVLWLLLSGTITIIFDLRRGWNLLRLLKAIKVRRMKALRTSYLDDAQQRAQEAIEIMDRKLHPDDYR